MSKKILKIIIAMLVATILVISPVEGFAKSKYVYTASETDVPCGNKFDFVNYDYVLNTESGCCHNGLCRGIKKAQGKKDMAHYVYIESDSDARIEKKCGFCYKN